MFGFGDGRALRAAAPFNPGTDLPTLENWLDASVLVGADGSALTTWTKAGGASGVSPTQANASRKPLLRTGANGVNGLNAVEFDGTDDYMLGTFNPGSTGLTIYIVGKTGPALTAFGTPVGSGGDNTSDNRTASIDWAFAHGNNGAGFGAGWAGPTENVQLGNVAGIATNQVWYARYRTNKIAWSIDGPNSGTPADTSFPGGTFQMHIGCASTLGSASTINFPYNGKLCEIIPCSSFIDNTTDALVKAYLQAKWAF